MLTSWLERNGFTILTPQSDGQQKVISHWDGALVIRPRPGSCVALREMTGGGTVVFEVGAASTDGAATVHLEGYVTGRGPGWKGKEYDLIPKNLAIAGILRKRGLLLMEDLQRTILSRANAPVIPSAPLRSAGSLPSPNFPPPAFCSHCGNPLSPGERFCTVCGFPTVSTPSPKSTPLGGPALPQPPVPPLSTHTAIGGKATGGPSLPLLPGETLLGRFASSTEGQKRVTSYNMYIVLIIMVGILLPFLLISLLARPASPLLLIFLYPPILIVGMMVYARHSIGKKGSTTVFVTDRRIIVDQPGAETSTSMALENVGHVEVNVDARAARRAGVAWVYVLPMGAPKAIVGRGRARHAASGVLWVPAVPLDSANSLRNLVVSAAQDVQSRLGYPAASMAQ